MSKKTFIRVIGLIAFCLIIGVSNQADAANKYWVCGDGLWSNPDCWSLTYGGTGGAGQPQPADKAYLTQSGTITYSGPSSGLIDSVQIATSGSGTLTLLQTSGELKSVEQYIGASSTFTQTGGLNTVTFKSDLDGTYNLSNTGSLATTMEYIGYAGRGTFNQSGGTHAISNVFYLGYDAIGEYNLSGGDLSLTGWSLNEYIGYSGQGIFNQSGGTHTLQNNRNLILGYDSSAQGTYNLSGGTLTVGGNILNGSGDGTLNIDGGTLVVNGGTIDVDVFRVGSVAGTTGSHTLSSGQTLIAGGVAVGSSGTGIFDQSGGTNTITTLNIGGGTGSGTYNLNSGSVTANETYIGSNGTFNQAGGTHFANALFLSRYTGSSTYNLSSGTLTSPSVFVGYLGTGTFNQTGGTVNSPPSGALISSQLWLGMLAGSSGTYNLSNGSLTRSLEYIGYIGSGTFNQTGGSNTVNKDLYLGYFDGSTGTYTLSGGNLSVSGNISTNLGSSGTLNVDGGTLSVGGNIDVDYFRVGYGSGSNGSYYLSNGQTLSANSEHIGYNGAGSFTQGGGTNTITSNLFLGLNLGSSGIYTLQNGTLNVGGDIVNGQGMGYLSIDGGILNVNGNVDVDFLRLGSVQYQTGQYTVLAGQKLSAYSEYIGDYGTGIYNLNGGTNNITYALILGARSGSSGTYNLNSGALTAQYEEIGGSGIGTFNQNSGTNTVASNLYLGSNAGSSGTYNLSGDGSLSATNEHIGYQGSGTFNQTGGTNTITADLYLGDGPTATGTYNLSGGTLNVEGRIVNGNGTGYLNIDGGTLNAAGSIDVDNFRIGNAAGSNGSFTLESRNSLKAGSETIGRGTFNQTGGINTVTNNLYLGSYSGSNGTYNLSNGSLSASNEYIGDSGEGTFNQTGGMNTIANNLYLGNSGSGTYTLSDGTLNVGGDIVQGSGWGNLLINNGTLIVGGSTNVSSLAIGHATGSNGSFTLESGKSLTAFDEVIGNMGAGTFNQNGGTNTVNWHLNLGGAPGASGTYNLNGGSLSANNEYIGFAGAGTFNQTGGTNTVTSALTIAAQNGSSGTYNMSGGSLTAGSILINSGGEFNNNGGSVVAPVTNFGTVTGDGTFTGDVTNYGTVNPGSSPGTLTIDGDYTQDVLGALLIELAEYAQGTEYDFLDITGSAYLEGTLDIDLLLGFDPLAGSSFTILHADNGIYDTFSILDLPIFTDGRYWNIVYGTYDVVLNVLGGQTSVPESSTLLLLGSGLIGLVGLRRRVKSHNRHCRTTASNKKR